MASLRVAVFAVSCALLAASVSSAPPPAMYKVGDERGWAVPSANGTETYNHWAKRNRFQVGDILNFKYANDSVLLVSHDDYKQCSTETPVSRFTGGDTKFTLDGLGPFYFVSGVPGHCEKGQRMIARVRMPSSLTAGVPAAAPGMPPTVRAGGAPRPAASLPAVPSVAGSGSASTPTPAPSPLPEASGASSRRALSVVSSDVVGLAVVGVVTLFVVV
ncbi:hypothetical protein PAHAL_1G377900 [Panicum hallii]|uniref:Phytocyanin domain-containing protein n=1 Tax=Panicum hallii TaxID=206008 RepID=A0A2S3GT96_9POAL|nr:early nodulin-like protein 1 [Panicum hallii]XP_025827718.1 early nodulin-like protein 1 [Panicum hallii]PAN07981.1 hypothetical protein PAHAL_1G377900 [Panicum hallii]